MKYIKYPLYVIALLLITLISLVAIINLTNFNISKPYIITLVQQELDRELTIDGNIKLELIPSPRLTINKLKFKNPTWLDSNNMLEFEYMDIKLDIKSLLNGKLEIQNIELRGVKIDLYKAENNVPNWNFPNWNSHEKEESEGNKGIDKSKQSVNTLLPFKSDVNIVFEDISINYRDKLLNENYNVFIHTLNIKDNNDESLILIKAIYNKNIEIELELESVLLKNILLQDSIPLGLKGKVGNVKLDLTTEIPITVLALDNMGMNLNIELADLSTIEEIFKIDLPKLGPINISTKISKIKDKINLSISEAEIGESILNGEVLYVVENKKPNIKIQLNFNELDLNELSQSFTEGVSSKKESKSKGDNVLFSNEELDLSFLNTLNADIYISIDKLIYDITDIVTLNLQADLNNGLLNIEKLKILNKHGEQINTKIRLDSNNNNKINIIIITDNIKLGENEDLSKYITGANTNANINVNMQGKSIKEMMSNLNGQVIVKVGEGTVDKALLNFIGSNILVDLVNAINPISKSSETSILECAAIRFDIKDGIATADKGIVMQTDQVQIISSGIINLKNETLEFGIKPQAREGIEINLNSFASMVKLDGPIVKPSINMSLKDSAIVYSYFATGGATFLAKSLFDTATRDNNPCKTAILGPIEE